MSKTYDTAFEHYRGRSRFTVSHPDYDTPLTVAAPDEISAIVAAAELWGVRWQRFSFYAYCDVSDGIYNRRNTSKTEGTD